MHAISKGNIILVVVVIIVVVGMAFLMCYPAWAMLEKCDSISIEVNASSYSVTTDGRCILEFCESKSVDNKTFFYNCRHETWREK